MGYPGLAQQDNVENAPYSYFSIQSVKTMSQWIQLNYVTNSVPKSNKKKFIIHVNTAFLLQGSAKDPDGDTRYYNWEQVDHAKSRCNHNDFSPTLKTGPIVRNYLPSTEPWRYIPNLERIKAGKLTDSGPSPEAWETVPTVPRTLTFAFVVIDRKLLSGEAGNTAVEMVGIKVIEGEPFRITSFNEPTTVEGGSTREVTWDVANTDRGEISASTVTISFASDGVYFNDILAAGVPNNGRAEVRFPEEATTTGRIRIRYDDHIIIAINTADITIN